MRKKTPKKKKYNNVTRIEKSSLAQEKIIEALVELLVKGKGADVQIEDIAKKSGISQRSIFRFFKDKASLYAATNNYIEGTLQKSITQIETHDVGGFAKMAFEQFDEHEDMVIAYIHSPFGKFSRAVFRKKLNAYLVDHILKVRKLTMTPEREMRIAVIVNLISAKIWDDIRTDFGFSGKQMGNSIEWAVNLLVEGL